MATRRNLIDYLPVFMQEYLEMQKIMASEQTEFESLWDGLNDLLSDQFIATLTANGVKRWEAILEITPKSTDTLEERRARILSRMYQDTPYTLPKLKSVLAALCDDGYTITLNAALYSIVIGLGLRNKSKYSDVSEVLEKMLPANLTRKIQILYNTHEMLVSYTHSQLSAKTHFQIREEVLA